MSEQFRRSSQDTKTSGEEQVREKAVHLWNMLTHMRLIMRQRSEDILRGVELNLEDWMDLIRWNKERRKARQGTRVRMGEERRGPGDDKVHFYASGSHLTTCLDTYYYCSSLNLDFLICEMGNNMKSSLLNSPTRTFDWKRSFIGLNNRKVQVHSLQVWLNPGI